MKIKKYKLILTFLLISLVFIGLKYSIKSSSAQDQSVSDAIAIRVLPNPEHYGIETWYKKQGFLGSPQSLIVDGYEAIRDGRTVYVAASNVDTSSKVIYTNIYLISYNQEVQNETIDILGQIVSNWSFNKNISSLTNNENIGHCSISTITCFSDEDCPSGLVCGNGDNYLFQKNKCVIGESGDGEFNNTKKCLTDLECNPGFYCSSLKSRITRDVIRLGRLADISSYIEDYNYTNGSYPTLRAGSYIPNFSLSVWPSWTNVLATDTGFNPNLIDPINSLGSCVKDNDPIKYDLTTCWDDKTPKFYDDNLNNGLDLPINSFTYVYKGENDGSRYYLCGNMETNPYTFSGEGMVQTTDFCSSDMRYGQTNENNKPVLVGYNLEGETGKVFSGEIEVIDPDGQILSWNISPVSSFSSWQSGVMPSLVSTNNPNKRILYSESAGAVGEYKVNLIVSDGGGDPLQEELTIKITDQAPQIQAEDADYIFKDESSILNYTAYIYDDNLLPIDNQNPLAYSLVTTYPSDFPNPKSDTSEYGDHNIGHGFHHEMIKIADNKYKLEITGLLGDTDGDGEIEEDANDLNLGSPVPDVIKFRLDVTDQSSLTTSKNFSINILHDAPVFNIDCPENLRISNSNLGYINQYNCYIELENQTEGTSISFTHEIYDPDNNNWEIGNNPLPINFEFNENSGLFSGYTLADRDYRIHVIATNEAGVSSEESFGIKVNDYCGDGFMQSPNDELKGGVYNDGFEQCDHDKGLATSFQDSYDNDKYYKCTTFLNTLFPLPTGSCIFNTEAGKCGDGVVQEETSVVGESEECDFGVNNLCCNNCEWDLSNVSTTDELSLGFIESINSIEELNKIKLDIGASAYLKTPDVVYVGEDGLFDIDIIPEGTITATQFLLEKSSYSYASKPSEKPDAIQRAKLMLAGVDENNEIIDKFNSFLYKMHSRFEDEFLVNFLYFAESPNAGKFLVGPGDGEASNFCDIRESWCYDKSVEEVLDCADDYIGSPDIHDAMNYADEVFGNLGNQESYSKSIVFFGSGLNTGSNTELTSLLNIMEGKDIRFYTIFLPNKFSDCSSNDRNENMCKWSSEWRDGVPVFGADCSQNCCSDFNSNCSNRDYNYINPYNGGETGTDWDQIVESIVSKINYNSVIYPDSVNVFGQNIKVITPDNSGENIMIKDRNFNIYDLSSNFSCDPSSVTCSPDQLLVSPIITGDGGAIELKNVRVNVLENLSACEGEIGDGGTGSGPGTGDNNGGVYYIN